VGTKQKRIEKSTKVILCMPCKDLGEEKISDTKSLDEEVKSPLLATPKLR